MTDNMEGQDGDEEVFEIVDFTTASEWEVFTSQVEEVFQEWKICGERPPMPFILPDKLSSMKWKERSRTINYSDFPFQVSFHEVIPDTSTNGEISERNIPEENEYDNIPSTLFSMHDSENCFPMRAHCIARWYGLRQFILVTPSSNSCSVTHCKARLILSALTIACGNTNCQVAVVVQVLRPTDRIFIGTLTANGIRAELDMVHIKRSAPRECEDFSGLVRLLGKKLNISEHKLYPFASARLTYMITDWPEEACWSQSPPDLDLDLSMGSSSELEFSAIGQLPFGLLYDPVRELHISAIWPLLYNASFKDMPNMFSLNPCEANQWTAKVIPNAGNNNSEGRQVAGLLGEHLIEFLSVCNDKRSVLELLGPTFVDNTSQDAAHFTSAFDRLTEHSVPSLGSVIMRRRQRHAKSSRKETTASQNQGPLTSAILVPLLTFLFPEEEDEGGKLYPTVFSRVPAYPPNVNGLPEEHILKEVSASFKTCPADSLSWRLSVLCCHALHSLGGLPAVAHLLHEFVMELRFRWDNGEPIPGITVSDPPDLGSSLLHQKLQMLNCCIDHRNNREKFATEVSSVMEGTEETDEFYDCTSDEEVEYTEDVVEDCKLSEWDKPEGRLRVCGDLKLLKSPSNRLYVPITQDPAPVTEDRLEEQADVLMRLGDTDEGSAMRARLLSSSLLSDMEAFKAANPGCILADFVRWYSPRDWIEIKGGEEADQLMTEGMEVINGHKLSDRMTLPGNLWEEVWQTAHPVPSRRQKRLFDDAMQAESVLHWLQFLTPGGLCQLVLPTLLHAACCTVAQQPALYNVSASAAGESIDLPSLQHQEGLSAVLSVISQRVGRLSRQPPELRRYREVVEQLITIEKCIGRAMSLQHKLLSFEADSTDNEVLIQLISDLLSNTEVCVEGAAKGVAGQAILRLFKRSLMNEDPLLFSNTDHSSTSNESTSSKPFAETVRSALGYVSAREYIIRVKAEYPSQCSRMLPHRIYATFMSGDFRIAGLFCKDTMFT